MTTLNFTAANGTTLAAYDAIAAGDTTALVIQGNKLTVTSGSFVDANFWYPNGQGDTQSVQASFDYTGVTGGEYAWLALQKKSGVLGYQMELRTSDGDIDVSRNGTFQTRLTGGGVPSYPIVVKATYNSATGVVEVFTNGVSRGTWTDGTPLTTGFPGARMYTGATVYSPTMDDWTDFYTASGGAAALQDAEWHPMEPQTNPLTVSVW